MQEEKSAILALIEGAKKKKNQDAIHSAYEFYKEEFEKAAMIHFKKHPFDYEMARLPDHDKQKQRFVFSEAFLALVDACKTFNSSRCSFETWVSRKIEWRFKGLCKKRYDTNEALKAMRCYGGEDNFSLGGYVKYGEKNVWKQFDTDNHEGEPEKNSDADAMKKILEAFPPQSTTYKILETGLQEGIKSQQDIAEKLQKTQQAISKTLKAVPKKLSERCLAECLEILGE